MEDQVYKHSNSDMIRSWKFQNVDYQESLECCVLSSVLFFVTPWYTLLGSSVHGIFTGKNPGHRFNPWVDSPLPGTGISRIGK